MLQWASLRLSPIMPIDWRVMLLATPCDRLSTCAASARELVRSLRFAPSFEDALNLLNHKVPSHCCLARADAQPQLSCSSPLARA